MFAVWLWFSILAGKAPICRKKWRKTLKKLGNLWPIDINIIVHDDYQFPSYRNNHTNIIMTSLSHILMMWDQILFVVVVLMILSRRRVEEVEVEFCQYFISVFRILQILGDIPSGCLSTSYPLLYRGKYVICFVCLFYLLLISWHRSSSILGEVLPLWEHESQHLAFLASAFPQQNNCLSFGKMQSATKEWRKKEKQARKRANQVENGIMQQEKLSNTSNTLFSSNESECFMKKQP